MLNRKMARSFGESSDVVDAATLNRAHTRLGRFFNGESKNPITLDDQCLRAVYAIDPDKIATWTKNDKLAEVIARARGAAAPTSPGTSPVMDWNALTLDIGLIFLEVDPEALRLLEEFEDHAGA